MQHSQQGMGTAAGRVQRAGRSVRGIKTEAGQPRWWDMDEYSYRGGVHELHVHRMSAGAGEISAVENGTVELSLVADRNVGFLLFRCVPGLLWAYAPLSWWLLREPERVLPPALAPEESAVLRLHLLDVKNGEARAQRLVQLPWRFCDVLHTCLREQSQRPFDGARVLARLEWAREHCRIPETMLERAMIGCRIEATGAEATT